MIYFLTIIVVLGVVVVAGLAILGKTKDRLDTNRTRRVDSERALNDAESALRRIANGSADPVLEAQIALDGITTYHEKELS